MNRIKKHVGALVEAAQEVIHDVWWRMLPSAVRDRRIVAMIDKAIAKATAE